jgi:ferritin-like metal-binding protein YciE
VVETSGNPTPAPLPREQVVAKAGQQTAGVAVMIAGGVVAAGGLIWGLMKKDEVVTTAIVPQADGASLVVGGRF